MLKAFTIACLSLSAVALVGCDQSPPEVDTWEVRQNCKARLQYQLDKGEISEAKFREEMRIQCDRYQSFQSFDPGNVGGPNPPTTTSTGTRRVALGGDTGFLAFAPRPSRPAPRRTEGAGSR